MLQENFLTAGELARRLSCQVSTIRAWTSRRKIPFVRLAGGRAVRYRESDIKAIAKAVPAVRPLSRPEDPTGEEGGGR